MFAARFLFTLIFVIGLLLGSNAQDDILTKLKNKIPNATFEELDNGRHMKREFIIMLEQPLDHNDSAAGTFQQRIFLAHYDVKAPNLIVTEGYSARPKYYELSEILKSNQIIVEYRFFGQSKPENYDYQYLTNDQAAADLHRIRELFGKVYKSKKWVSTGISKGGTTTCIYKAKYPKDVMVAVPIVGPLPKAREDKRMDDFINSQSTAECRERLSNFQKNILDNRDQILPKVDSLADANNFSFNRIGLASAMEYAVLEFTFSFWQYGHDCDRVKDSMTVHQQFELLNEIVGFDFYEDRTVAYFEPSFYQFMTQNGYYGFIHDHVLSKIKNVTVFDNSPFGPKNEDLNYDPNYMIKVRNWLYQHGDKMIYIHGGLDPWGACRDRIPADRDAHMFIKEGGDHTTRISSFGKNEKDKIYKYLGQWLKTEIYPLAEASEE